MSSRLVQLQAPRGPPSSLGAGPHARAAITWPQQPRPSPRGDTPDWPHPVPPLPRTSCAPFRPVPPLGRSLPARSRPVPGAIPPPGRYQAPSGPHSQLVASCLPPSAATPKPRVEGRPHPRGSPMYQPSEGPPHGSPAMYQEPPAPCRSTAGSACGAGPVPEGHRATLHSCRARAQAGLSLFSTPIGSGRSPRRRSPHSPEPARLPSGGPTRFRCPLRFSDAAVAAVTTSQGTRPGPPSPAPPLRIGSLSTQALVWASPALSLLRCPNCVFRCANTKDIDPGQSMLRSANGVRPPCWPLRPRPLFVLYSIKNINQYIISD
mgnify:CR=1 FL=1